MDITVIITFLLLIFTQKDRILPLLKKIIPSKDISNKGICPIEAARIVAEQLEGEERKNFVQNTITSLIIKDLDK